LPATALNHSQTIGIVPLRPVHQERSKVALFADSSFVRKSDSEIAELHAHAEKWRVPAGDRVMAVVRDMSGAEETDLTKLQEKCQRFEAQVNA
jgi:hypothetical protein